MAQMVPVPLALRHLIESNNQLLKIHQADLTAKVMQANEEMMRMLNLNPSEGWRLDLDSLTYVKVENTDATSVSE
jgi:hypothetical protein